jgi:drug/metabolite transporter (DMT)-like permease
MQALLIGGLFLSEAFDVRMLAGAALVVGAVALNAKAGPSPLPSEDNPALPLSAVGR